jgi:hypothetical protein
MGSSVYRNLLVKYYCFVVILRGRFGRDFDIILCDSAVCLHTKEHVFISF